MSNLLDEAQKGYPDEVIKFWNAARDGNLTAVRKYIDAGGDINLKDDMENTALMLAATNNQLDIIKLLVSHGADIKASNFMGATAIFMAKHNHHTKIVELLEKADQGTKQYVDFENTMSPKVSKKKWWEFWK